MHVTVNQLSELLRLDRRAIKRRLDSLEPVKTQGRAVYYESCEAIPLALGGTLTTGERLDLSQERAALAGAQRHLCELKIAETEKRLLPVDHVQDFIGQIISENRQRMVALPRRIAIAVEGFERLPEIEEKARDLVYEVMNEFAEAFNQAK